MAANARLRDSTGTDALRRARAAADRFAWTDACAEYTAADHDQALAASDLEGFARVAHMLGRTAVRDDVSARAHQAYVAAGDAEGAARGAFWIGYDLLMTGEVARGSGWLARAQRLLDDANLDCVMRGYLLLPQAIRLSTSGSSDEAYATFAKAIEIGQRFRDRSLVTFARHGMGRVLTTMGRVAEGVALLDEAMAAVAAGEVDATLVGPVYCSVIETCHTVFDLRRAQEWTDALSSWYESQPDMVAFRGRCLIHRAEMMQLHGDWSHALDEARRACDWLSDPPGNPAAGSAFYRSAELHRVRGDFAEADAAYRAASDCGRQPHPGLALLWMSQGRTDAAVVAIRRLLGERQEVRRRVQVLEACIEIAHRAGDVALARSAAIELGDFAEQVKAPYLAAAAAHGFGWTLLAEGDAADALERLSYAAKSWHTLRAPFEHARTRVLLARAHRALGDDGTASLELDAARRTFEDMGAIPDLARADALAKPAERSKEQVLTAREVDVLTLVANGKTNRAIANALGISEKTVARHVSNIFTKLDVPNRAAATAYAYEHNLQKRAST